MSPDRRRGTGQGAPPQFSRNYSDASVAARRGQRELPEDERAELARLIAEQKRDAFDDQCKIRGHHPRYRPRQEVPCGLAQPSVNIAGDRYARGSAGTKRGAAPRETVYERYGPGLHQVRESVEIESLDLPSCDWEVELDAISERLDRTSAIREEAREDERRHEARTRWAAGETQKTLAKEYGVSQQAISKWCRAPEEDEMTEQAALNMMRNDPELAKRVWRIVSRVEPLMEDVRASLDLQTAFREFDAAVSEDEGLAA